MNAILIFALMLSISAAAPYSVTNPCTADNFEATQGYKVYGIFNNPNVKLYYLDGEQEKEIENKPPTVNDSAISPDTDAFRGFKDLWYSYDGYCLGILKDIGILEIKFHGTAINLGLVLYRSSAASINMSADVTIDGTEYKITGMDMTCPTGDDLNQRLVCPRYFRVSGLSDGWHTLRLKSTGTERFIFEYYEIVETTPTSSSNTSVSTTAAGSTSPSTADMTVGITILTAAIGTGTVIMGKRRKHR